MYICRDVVLVLKEVFEVLVEGNLISVCEVVILVNCVSLDLILVVVLVVCSYIV